MPAQNKFQDALSGKKPFTVIGMMSGTSMDGIDAVLIRTDGESAAEVLFAAEYAYDAAFRERIEASLEIAAKLKSAEERTPLLAELEAEITLRHAAAVERLLESQKLKADAIDLIGFHGQTVLHRPEAGYTVQLGDGQALADQTGIAVAYDLRSNDMTHGGQGAPLVPVYHQMLAGMRDSRPDALQNLSPVAFVNIGGISNITYVSDEELIAFDTGPGNALIDQWVQAVGGIPFDEDGMIASEGGIVESIVDNYLAESFFEQTVPKSLDRNDFSALMPGSAGLEDGARSLARVSAEAIIKSCDHLPEPPALWIICGGGRKNPSIMADLMDFAAELNDAKVIVAEEAGFNGDSMEAEAWGFLAARAVKQLPITFPKTTGCKKPVSGGKIVFPKSLEL